jgi:hypothetical protein
LTVALSAAFYMGFSAGAAEEKEAQKSRFFEIRTYTADEGKLDDLNRRFRDHTIRLFEKHGMTNIGYWTPVDGPEAKNTLVYILAYPSREAHAKSWEGFRNDPDWQAARQASEVNGRLVTKVVSQFLAPTDYSPLK